MPAIRLCIFGGGSSYTHHMLSVFARHVASGDLAGSSLCLYDIDPEAARLMSEFGNSVARAKGLDFTVAPEPVLERALEGAEFVLSSFRAGGLDQRYLDETIPLKYGLLGQETTGVGGVFMICRNAPAVTQLAQAMERVCPQATLINYTNPTGMVTDLSTRVSRVRTFGLCDGVLGVKELVGFLMGLPWEDTLQIEAQVAGVNHCTWTLALRYRGEDLYGRMDELVGKGEKLKSVRDHYAFGDACRLYRYYGLFPGSTYYTPYYYNLRKTIDTLRTPGYEFRSQNLKKQAMEIYDHCRRQLGRKDADFLPYCAEHAAHGDQAIGTIHAIACDTQKTDVVNVRNNGVIRNLPDEAVVEVPAVLDRHGAAPLSLAPLPDSVAGVVQMVDLHCRLAVTAAQTGDRRLVLQAAMAHPCNRDLDAVEPCLEEMFEKNKDWLPQFRT